MSEPGPQSIIVNQVIELSDDSEDEMDSVMSSEESQSSVDSKPFQFLNLPADVQSLIVDCLGIRSITTLRATCRTLRALPNRTQMYAAIKHFEDEWENCSNLFQEIESDKPGPSVRSRVILNARYLRKFPAALNVPFRFQYHTRSYKSYGSLAAWMGLVADHGIDSYLGKRVACNTFEFFHCFNCLQVKDVSQFDLSQFGASFWAYLSNTPPLDLPSTEDIFHGGDEERWCLTCRLESTEALQHGIGWLESHAGDFHMRCSNCLQRDKLTRAFTRHTTYSSTGQQSKARAYEEPSVCRRLVAGNLCRACFEAENREWFAFRTHLTARIEAESKYLEWMVNRDDWTMIRDCNDPAPPIEQVAPYWQ